MWDHEERTTLRELFRALLNLVEDLQKALKKYLAQAENPPPPVHATTLKGDLPMNYQLNTLDSVSIAITDTVDATGLAAVIDPGSLSAGLSDTTDSVSVSGSTVTLTGGTNLATSKTVTVSGTVGGVASTPWVGTYDVVAAVVEPTTTTLSGTFAGETAPPSGTATLPVPVTLANGTVLPAGSPLPAGTTYSATSNELVNADGTAYQG
jgi:hypothetical protein